jgi:hypothetical protein
MGQEKAHVEEIRYTDEHVEYGIYADWAGRYIAVHALRETAEAGAKALNEFDGTAHELLELETKLRTIGRAQGIE